MNTTSVHIKIEPTLKEQAQRLADELGLSLSALMKVLLKQFIRTKHLSIGINEIPNKHLSKSLKQSDDDIKAGKVVSFANGKVALSYIDSLIEHDKQNK
jgi:addiction module RelB/DinJ family antitoxin